MLAVNIFFENIENIAMGMGARMVGAKANSFLMNPISKLDSKLGAIGGSQQPQMSPTTPPQVQQPAVPGQPVRQQ